MERAWYADLATQALAGTPPARDVCERLLTDPGVDLLRLLDAAFEVRRAFHGREVTVHILNNAQNGHCPEDCRYCAQAKSSEADIAEYPLKPDAEILDEARRAWEAGAHRYCMVFAGRGPSRRRVEKLAGLVREIKTRWPIEVCVSPGLLDDEGARLLKAAGLDRLNHNLNTSERNYPNICTTHTFADRVRTLESARRAGLEVCSGLIAGMGETAAETVDLAFRLREVDARSIPINFLLPIEGTAIGPPRDLSPDYALRVLCLFRFVNPSAEIRAAAGRETHLRSLEVLCLYPANSIFMDGYLNATGHSRLRTLEMIRDAGFTVRSEHGLEELLAAERERVESAVEAPRLKGLAELRPAAVACGGVRGARQEGVATAAGVAPGTR